jgi:hypothetical protein
LGAGNVARGRSNRSNWHTAQVAWLKGLNASHPPQTIPISCFSVNLVGPRGAPPPSTTPSGERLTRQRHPF